MPSHTHTMDLCPADVQRAKVEELRQKAVQSFKKIATADHANHCLLWDGGRMTACTCGKHTAEAIVALLNDPRKYHDYYLRQGEPPACGDDHEE